MSRLAVVLLLALVMGVAAFRMPSSRIGNKMVASKSSVNMIPTEVAVEATTKIATQFSQLIAAESDFGGYAGPAGSLILIGFLILTLAPPLAEKNSD